jgi:elongation factor P
MFIEHNGQPHRVLDYEHVKPGKGQAFVRVKAKNMSTGNVIEITYKSSDSIELADFEQVFAEYSYNDGDYYYFVSKTTYEMLAVPTKNIENEIKFLKEGMEVVVFVYKGQPIGIELPRHVELKVWKRSLPLREIPLRVVLSLPSWKPARWCKYPSLWKRET